MRKGVFGLVAILLLLPGREALIHAQMNYRPGKVITLEGDTLAGWIRDQGTIKSLKFCKFKPDKKTVPRIYPASGIKAYEMTGYKHYVAMDWQQDSEYQRIFAEVLLDGELDLYHNWRKKNLAFILRLEDGKLMALQNEEFTYRPEAPAASDRYVYGYKYEGFIKLYRDSLIYAFSDVPEVAAGVDEISYRRNDLMDLTSEYMDRKYGKGEEKRYRKDTRLTRDHFGIYAGGMISHLIYLEIPEGSIRHPESGLIYSYPVGLFYQIPLSWVNERFYFQVEANYRYLEYDPLLYMPPEYSYCFAYTHTLGIPLLLSYRLSVKPFSPIIGAGKELGFNLSSYGEYQEVGELFETYINEYSVHRINKGGWFAEVGFDWELSPNMAIFSKIRIQRYRNKFIPLQSHNNINFNVAVGDESLSNAASLFVGLRF